MDLYFSSDKQQRLLESSKDLTRKYGADNATLILRRLGSLNYLESMKDFYRLSGNPEELVGDRAGTFSLRLKGRFRLIFAPHSPESAQRDDGTLDLSQVRAVDIIGIEDYHG